VLYVAEERKAGKNVLCSRLLVTHFLISSPSGQNLVSDIFDQIDFFA